MRDCDKMSPDELRMSQSNSDERLGFKLDFFPYIFIFKKMCNSWKQDASGLSVECDTNMCYCCVLDHQSGPSGWRDSSSSSTLCLSGMLDEVVSS